MWHIVSSKKFHRISSSPQTLPYDNYDVPEEVRGKRKLLIALLRNEARKNFLMSGP